MLRSHHRKPLGISGGSREGNSTTFGSRCNPPLLSRFLGSSRGYYMLEAVFVIPILALLLYGAVRLSILSRIRIQRVALAHLVSLLPTETNLIPTGDRYKERVVSFLKIKVPEASCESPSLFSLTCSLAGYKFELSNLPFRQEVTVTHPALWHPLTIRGYKVWPY